MPETTGCKPCDDAGFCVQDGACLDSTERAKLRHALWVIETQRQIKALAAKWGLA